MFVNCVGPVAEEYTFHCVDFDPVKIALTIGCYQRRLKIQKIDMLRLCQVGCDSRPPRRAKETTAQGQHRAALKAEPSRNRTRIRAGHDRTTSSPKSATTTQRRSLDDSTDETCHHQFSGSQTFQFQFPRHRFRPTHNDQDRESSKNRTVQHVLVSQKPLKTHKSSNFPLLRESVHVEPRCRNRLVEQKSADFYQGDPAPRKEARRTPTS